MQREYSRSIIIQNIVLTGIVELCLRVFGFKRSWNMMLWCVPIVPGEREKREIIREHLLAMKHAKKKKLVLGKCLARSIVLWWQLRRRGLNANIVIGVKNKIDFRAHAWVEYDGEPLNAGAKVHNRYKNIATFDHPIALG